MEQLQEEDRLKSLRAWYEENSRKKYEDMSALDRRLFRQIYIDKIAVQKTKQRSDPTIDDNIVLRDMITAIMIEKGELKNKGDAIDIQ